MLKYFFLFVLLFSFGAKAFSKEDSFFSKNLSQREMQKEEQLELSLYEVLLYRVAFEAGRDCKNVIEIEGKAQQEDGVSQFILADIYKTGLCVNKDEKEALKWMIKSSDNGFVKAFYDRAKYHQYGIGAEKDLKLAFYWAKKSLAANDKRAYSLLSKMYSQGIGTTINYKKGLEMALKGAEIGDEASQAWASVFFAYKEELYSPIEAYKWALLANNSNDDELKKFTKKIIDELDSVLSIKQIQQAQNMAENWKPKTQNLKIKKFQLPKLAKNYSDNITKTQALSELDKLEIGKDRYLFFQAIEEDNLEIFKLFIKAGASIETKSALGFATPLYSSIIFNSKKIFDYLMKNGVQINTELNHNKDTPVLFALSEKRIDMAKRLINAGANLSHPGIMYNAVKSNDISLLQKLYNLGVTNIDNDYGENGTPLENAVSVIDDKNFSRHCFADSTKFLLEKGANPNKLRSGDVSWAVEESILMRSISSKNPQQCIILLLEHKANINYHDNQGRTALYQATLIGNPEIVKILLQYGANKDDKYYLLENEIPMSIEKPLSKTVLTGGGTMLMFAVSEGYISVVKELLENGANPLIEAKNGLTALSIAKENKNQILIDLLSEYMKKFSTSNKVN